MSAPGKAIIIAPGRGTYGKAELGSITRLHGQRRAGLIAEFDRQRAARDQESITALDGAARFSVSTHMRGDVAAPLIYTGSLCDALDILPDRYEAVAALGNSMGWYSALAIAGAVTAENGFHIANAMGLNSQVHGDGGQILLQIVDDNWRQVPGLRDALCDRAAVIDARSDHSLALSIDLGGMLVFAGNDAGLAALIAEAPPTPGRDPLRLGGHGPFHTSLMQGSADRAQAEFSPNLFGVPAVPLVDGRGHIWRRHASDPARMWDYSFGHQILQPYDFALSLRVAMREFAPDAIILTGPGDTMGGAIAQILIDMRWQGMRDKSEFLARQKSDPILLSMGRAAQRVLVTG